ncbi:MAG: hypothetical protein WCS77_06630 [Elusimicrobiaceae bacterium]
MKKAFLLLGLAAPAMPLFAQSAPPPMLFPAAKSSGTATAPQNRPPVYQSTSPTLAVPQTAAPAVSSATLVSGQSEASPAKDYSRPAVPISGMVLMPTAYRGRGLNTIGVSLDMNAAYYIGRIYGKNSYNWTLSDKNYLDRIGQWIMTADGKMLVQTEGDWRPAVAAGVMGMFTFRDSGQPKLDDPTVSVSVNSTQGLASAYVVASKRFFSKRLITSAGYMEGSIGNFIPLLSEFLTPEAITLSGHPGQSANSRSLLYGGMLFMLTPSFPVGFEVIIPQGAAMNPKLVNFHLGSLLKMNFEVAVLNFEGGWDALGMIQFRYTFFPK